jgi:predicted nucleic acid-binding protein
VASDFWDTSALAKLYLEELGSAWCSSRRREYAVAISRLTFVEFASILRRKRSEGWLDARIDDAYQAFLRDRAESQFEVVEVSMQLLASATGLLLDVSHMVRTWARG